MTAWLLILPFLVCFLLFTVYPMIDSFLLTFQKVKGMSAQFIGLDNYKRLLQDSVFFISLKNTFFFWIVWLPIQVIVSLGLSAILNSKAFLLRGVFRTALFLPCVTSLVAYSLVFRNLFSSDGLINRLLALFGAQDPIAWLNDPFWAKILIVIALTWRWTGYDMMFYLSGLQNISPELYEAASIDGANGPRRFFSITLPMLKPIVLFCTVMNTIGILQLFDEPMNLTGGGPGSATHTLSLSLYKQSFTFTPNFGYSATISYAIVLIICVITFFQFKIAGDNHEI